MSIECPIKKLSARCVGEVCWEPCNWKGSPEAAVVHMFTCHGHLHKDRVGPDYVSQGPMRWTWTIDEDEPRVITFEYMAIVYNEDLTPTLMCIGQSFDF